MRSRDSRQGRGDRSAAPRVPYAHMWRCEVANRHTGAYKQDETRRNVAPLLRTSATWANVRRPESGA